MGVTLCECESDGKRSATGRIAFAEISRMNGMISPGFKLPLAFPDPRRLPRNHVPPTGHALFLRGDNDKVGKGELARDARLAALEAVLFLTDEPLTVKRLALVLRLKDGAEARRQVRRLQALYEK
jgi:hypothetical protein